MVAATGNDKNECGYVFFCGRGRPYEYETVEKGRIAMMEGLVIRRYITQKMERRYK